MFLKALRYLALAAVVAVPIMFANAQVFATFTPEQDHPRFSVYTGYSFMRPGGTVFGNDLPKSYWGTDVSGTYFFSRHWGATFDWTGQWYDEQPDGHAITTLMAGPVFRLPMKRLVPFAHAEIGKYNVRGLNDIYPSNLIDDKPFHNLGIQAGGGADFALAHGVSLRLIEVDYFYAHRFPNFGLQLNSTRLTSGLVWNFGSTK
jgi:hypothetical protein